MTLQEAFIELSNSAGYKETAKLKTTAGARHRTWLSRFRKDNLKSGAMVDILTEYGYEIKASRVSKKRH
jgi:hypothetical protein